MSIRLPREEFGMQRDIADVWKRHWMILAILVLTATIGLGVFFRSVLCAYSQSHYDYLTSAPALSRQAGLA
jgi:hypothetical protein